MSKETEQSFAPPKLDIIIPPHLQDERLKNAFNTALDENDESFPDFLWHILNNIHTRTAQHAKRVSEVSGLFSQFLGLEEAEIEAIKIAALLHDIGKIDPWYYPNGGKTNKNHANIGAEIAERLGFAEEIVAGIKYHHERRNGTGPNHKKAGEIPLVAEIIRYADIFDRIFSQQKNIFLRKDNNLTKHDLEELFEKTWQKINELDDNKLNLQFLSRFKEFLLEKREKLVEIYSVNNKRAIKK